MRFQDLKKEVHSDGSEKEIILKIMAPSPMVKSMVGDSVAKLNDGMPRLSKIITDEKKRGVGVAVGDSDQNIRIRMPKGELLSQWRQKKRTRRNSGNDAEKKRPSIVNANSSAKKTDVFSAKITAPSCLRNSEEPPSSGDKERSSEEPGAKSGSFEKKRKLNTNGKDLKKGATTKRNTEEETCVQSEEHINELEWPRILLSLSKKEKEDDFFLIKGAKLPLRPKKRPKVVERALQNCCPGFWLSDLTRGRYDVRERKSTRKKPRGLRAMGNRESFSD